MAVCSQSEYIQPLEMFIQSVETMWDERAENSTDVSKHLLVDINILLKDLGLQLANLKPDQLSAMNKTFQKITPLLAKFAEDKDLWESDPDQAQRLLQTIATINNITNSDAIPFEAQQHQFFHGDALKHGLIALQDLDLLPENVPTPQNYAMNYAVDHLKKNSIPETLIATQTSAKTVRSATDTVVGIEEQG